MFCCKLGVNGGSRAKMRRESHQFDKKSLRCVLGKAAEWHELTYDCVAFATSLGGVLAIGIEDDEDQPAPQQQIRADLPDRLRKRIGELTVNVTVHPTIKTAENGGQYLQVMIPRSPGVPSTIDGRYFKREGDRRRPVRGDEILHLSNDRSTFDWEGQGTDVDASWADPAKVKTFADGIRGSDRVKGSVKEKSVGGVVGPLRVGASESADQSRVFYVSGAKMIGRGLVPHQSCRPSSMMGAIRKFGRSLERSRPKPHGAD
jgi:hypothetical protein